MSQFGAFDTTYQIRKRLGYTPRDMRFEEAHSAYFHELSTSLAAGDREQNTDDMCNMALVGGELLLYRNGRSYYKVFPEYIRPLCATNMAVPAKYFKLPYSAW